MPQSIRPSQYAAQRILQHEQLKQFVLWCYAQRSPEVKSVLFYDPPLHEHGASPRTVILLVVNNNLFSQYYKEIGSLSLYSDGSGVSYNYDWDSYRSCTPTEMASRYTGLEFERLANPSFMLSKDIDIYPVLPAYAEGETDQISQDLKENTFDIIMVPERWADIMTTDNLVPIMIDCVLLEYATAKPRFPSDPMLEKEEPYQPFAKIDFQDLIENVQVFDEKSASVR